MTNVNMDGERERVRERESIVASVCTLDCGFFFFFLDLKVGK